MSGGGRLDAEESAAAMRAVRLWQQRRSATDVPVLAPRRWRSIYCGPFGATVGRVVQVGLRSLRPRRNRRRTDGAAGFPLERAFGYRLE